MTTIQENSQTSSIPEPDASRDLTVVNPYLHIEDERIYNPLTDRTLTVADALHSPLRAMLSGALLDPTLHDQLRSDGWTVAAEDDLSASFYLKIVSLETHTVCNQKCYFCPVSVAPRDDYYMPTELFERVVNELTAYKSTLEAVFLLSYNEPTLDKRFVDQCRTILAAGLPTAVNSNATGLTPARVDALVEAGPLRYLSINLSTLDREKYKLDRGADHLDIVLRNLDYAKDKAVAEQMDMAVLGTGDAIHKRDFEQINERYGSSRFNVKYFEVMDRAGYLEFGLKSSRPGQKLRGCDNLGSRPLQHLHITPEGRCVLCCEDYDQHYVVGDLRTTDVAGVLAGPELARMRRWTYGVEDAPADFICRSCIFARY